jgi:hypothetical protein
MTTTFENARIGDRVWDILRGWGEVSSVTNDGYYTIAAEFGNGQESTYTVDGREYEDTPQTLFWDEIKFEAPVQPPRRKLIHGVEVPDISFSPKAGESFHTPSIESSCGYKEVVDVDWNFRSSYIVSKGLCYPYTEEGKQAAILHAKAMIGIKD